MVIFWNNRLRFGVALLAAAMLLALAKPALHLIFRPTGGSSGLHWDYGVPTQWYGDPGGARPAGVKLPENSIGLDFLSFDTYIRCLGLGPGMYGSHCEGDPFERPFAYPPLLTAAFFWVSYFSTPVAAALWSLMVLLLLGFSGVLWGMFPSAGTVRRSVGSIAVPAFLLTVSYPAVFAYERGNTEALILAVLGVAAWMLRQRRWFWAGFFGALAAAAKLYPLLSLAGFTALGVLLLFVPKHRRSGVLLLAGAAAGLVLPFVIMHRQYVRYFSSVLPHYKGIRLMDPDCSFCHSWPSAFALAGYGLAILLGAIATVHFAVHARRFVLRNDAADLTRSLLGFAFGIGISVYVPLLSYDYSLVMLIPLLLMCMLWDETGVWNPRGIGFVVLTAGIALPRWLEGLVWTRGSHSVFLMLQTAGLILIGLSLVLDLKKCLTKR